MPARAVCSGKVIEGAAGLLPLLSQATFSEMIRRVVKYGHPVLRQKGERVESITRSVRQLIEDLIETMYAAKGIGLAAQQIGEALQVTVLDVRQTERPSTMHMNGAPVDVAVFMPLVLVNPQVTPLGTPVPGSEGCLSFPEIFAEINRPETADVVALNEKGERIEFRCEGLLARAIQHEVDHLNGILYIDRMDAVTKAELKPMLTSLHSKTREALSQNPAVARVK